MTVYVDAPIWPYRGMLMCHMVADAREELDAMADRIGVARKWIQHPGEPHEHYDVCKAKRALAVKAGAVELDRRGIVAFWRARKNAQQGHLGG